MTISDDPWAHALDADGPRLVWPAPWSLTGPAARWTWGAELEGSLEFNVLLRVAADEEPLDVAVTGLADPIDGLFAVRVVPCADSAIRDAVWMRLSAAARALGLVESEDVGLLCVAASCGEVRIDTLDRTIEIHPRAL